MGVYFDPSLNEVRGEEAFITYAHSPVKALIIPTDEEVMIARDVVRLALILKRIFEFFALSARIPTYDILN